MICFDTYGAMTVGDLIKELQTVPSDLKVFVMDGAQWRDVALTKLELRKRMHKNGSVDSDNEPVRTYTADCHIFPDDGPPEACIGLVSRPSYDNYSTIQKIP